MDFLFALFDVFSGFDFGDFTRGRGEVHRNNTVNGPIGVVNGPIG